MLKKALVVVVFLIVAFAAFVAMQPSEFRVERTISVAAPADRIFPLVNDFHNSASWSPWDKLDPAMKKSFEGPAEGVGSVYSWDGNEKVGAGRMSILESQPNERVKMRLENFRPFESTSTTELVLTPRAGATSVQWSLTGHNGFVEKAVCLFVSMDEVIGPDFEKGLAQLKTAAESTPQTETVSTPTL